MIFKKSSSIFGISNNTLLTFSFSYMRFNLDPSVSKITEPQYAYKKHEAHLVVHDDIIKFEIYKSETEKKIPFLPNHLKLQLWCLYNFLVMASSLCPKDYRDTNNNM